MNYISLFSGIEAASVGWAPLGWKPVAYAEIDPFCCAVLQHHYPTVPNVGDMTAVNWQAYDGQVDVVVGGPPCQAFSVAGQRQSLEDPRGNLLFTYLRALNAIDPLWSLTENVPGLLSTRDNAFGIFLAGLVGADAPLVPARGQRWTDAGVVTGPRRTAAWRILDAQWFGVPQRRRRVFILAIRGARNWRAPAALLSLTDSVQGHPTPRRAERQDVAACLTGRLDRVRRQDAANLVAYRTSPNCGAWETGDRIDALTTATDRTAHLIFSSTGQGYWDDAATVGTLRAREQESHEHLVLRDVAPCLTQNYGKQPDNSNTSQGPCVVAEGTLLRRLTPREAEKLMGLPCDYTLVPYRGKSAKDGQRYKSIGNSFAVPIIHWIGERIAQVNQVVAPSAAGRES